MRGRVAARCRGPINLFAANLGRSANCGHVFCPDRRFSDFATSSFGAVAVDGRMLQADREA